MHSNDIAKQFYIQGRANKWLSQKRTSWLYGQACRDADRKLTTHGTPTASGMFEVESGETIGWQISVSPVNGCARFATHSVTELHNQAMAEREDQLERGKEFCQLLREHPEMAVIHPPDLVARMFRVSVTQVEQWLRP